MSEQEKQLPFSLIQAYLRAKGYLVSTIYRQSSIGIDSPPWYFKTIVWKWDERERKTTELIDTRDSGGCESLAYLKLL